MATEISHLFARISADTSSFDKGMKSSHKALTSFSGALGLGLAAAAAIGVAAIAGVGAVIVKGVKSAAEFEQNMANIAAVMGKTREEIAPLGKMISNLALDPSLKVNADEASAAVGRLAQMGVTMGDQIAGVTKQVILFSNATGGDMATSAEISVKAMRLWNIAAEDMATVTNQTLGVIQQTGMTVNDYNLALARGGGALADYGVTHADFNAMLAITNIRYSGAAEAGTGMRRMYEGFIPKTAEATDEMKRLGLMLEDGTNKFYNANGTVKDAAEVAGLLQGAYAGLTDQQKAQSMITVWSSEAQGALNAMLEGGTQKVLDMKTAIGNTDAEKAAAERMDTLLGQWEIFIGYIDEIVKQIGDAFLPALKEIVKWMQGMSEKYLPDVVLWFGKFGAWITESLPRIEAFIVKLGGWAGAFMDWAQGSDSSMGLVATAATWMGTKVAGVFGNLMAWVKDNLPIWVAQLKEWGAAAGDWIIETGWPLLVANLRKWGANLWAWIKENYPIWKENLREWGEAAGNWITDVGWPLLKKNLQTWWVRLKEWAKTQLPYWIEELAEWAIQLGAWAIDGISFLIRTLADGMHEVKMWLRGTGQGGVKDGTDGYASAFVKWIKDDAWPILKPALQGLIDSLVELAGQSTGLIFDAAMAIGRAIVNGMIDGAKDMWKNATRLWRDLPQNVIDEFNYILGIDSPSTVFAAIGNSIMDGFQVGIDEGLVDALKTGANASRLLSNTIKNEVSLPQISGAGASAMQALSDGMKSKMAAVWAVGASAMSGLANVMSTTLGIHSPSTVFYEMGTNIAQCLANGLVDTMPIVDRVMAGMSKTVTTVVAGMYDQINAATAEFALRATFAGIQAGEMANVANQIITQNNANGSSAGTGYNYLDEVYAKIAREQAVQDAARAAQLAAEAQAAAQREAATQQTYASKASVFAGTNYQQYLNPYGAGAQLSGYGEGRVGQAVNLLEQLKSAGGVENVTKSYNITVENMNLGGSGNAVTDIIQAINFLNASYGYGY